MKFKDNNEAADFWYYVIGVNIGPANSIEKKPIIPWKELQNNELPEEQLKQWKQEDKFKDGIFIVTGKVWRSSHKNQYLCCVDADNQKGIDELCPSGIDFIAKNTLVEQHKNTKGKGHFYFYTTKPVRNKDPDILDGEMKPKIEIKSENRIVYCTPSMHKDGSRYEILGKNIPAVLDQIEAQVNEICKKHGIGYLEKKQRKKIDELRKGSSEGSRNQDIFDYIKEYRKLNPNKSLEFLIELALEKNKLNKPPLEEEEVITTIKSNYYNYDFDKKEDVQPLTLSEEEYQRGIEQSRKSLIETVEKHFPERSFVLLICLAVKAQLLIEHITQPFALWLLGNPSTKKTTILELVDSLGESYLTDKFTPKSFVSHSANVKKNELKDIDLLPKIKGKVFITPELAPLITGNEDTLTENFGILIRVLDGHGLWLDSGVHGGRGYKGNYCFMMLGAAVDIPYKIWAILGNLGPRLYFLRIPDPLDSISERKAELLKSFNDVPYEIKVKECRKVLKEYWKYVKSRPGDNKIVWNREKDDSYTREKIADATILLAKLRASIKTYQTRDGNSSGTNYNFEMPIEEYPDRAFHALYNMARGNAVLYGRNYITKDDLSVIFPIALCSAEREKVALFKLLIENNGKVDSDTFVEKARVARNTALKHMELLRKVGIVTKEDVSETTKPKIIIELKKDFEWFLSDEFKVYWNSFIGLHTPKMFALSKKDKEYANKKGVRSSQKTLEADLKDTSLLLCGNCDMPLMECNCTLNEKQLTKTKKTMTNN